MLTNFANSKLLKRGSGRIVRVGADALRDILVTVIRDCRSESIPTPLLVGLKPDLHYFFGLFAPYFERPCFRSATPAQSGVPRTVWQRTPGRSFTRPPRISTTECS